MSDVPERIPLTDEQRERSEHAIKQLKRDLAVSARRPTPEVVSPGKFFGPIGLDNDGNLQSPLSFEEQAHNERVRRSALADKLDDADSGK